jgi:hypothetical protein
VVSALGLFGETAGETESDSLPANPAEWLASLGAQDEDEDEEE